jgi:hypothetical protein
MKKLSSIISGLTLTILLFASCNLIKSEDEKIADALVGKSYEEDRVDDEGGKFKNIKHEFFKDGKFKSKSTYESVVSDTSFETSDINFEIQGQWKVKDKLIYYTYDFDKLKVTPDFYMNMKDEMIKSIKDKNTPDKVIEYDAMKIVYENSDGQRYVKKKIY